VIAALKITLLHFYNRVIIHYYVLKKYPMSMCKCTHFYLQLKYISHSS